MDLFVSGMPNKSYRAGLACIGLLFLMAGCGVGRLPVKEPVVITQKTLHDTDDPAIWVHPEHPGESLVFGTDKETDGAVYAYDLQGRILEGKTIRGIQRPNNVDVEYGLLLGDGTQTDILVFTERERQQIRVYSVPDMQPLDGGGFGVFEDETDLANRLPMGVALYKSPLDGTIYVIVGRKQGPQTGYLYQYALRPEASGLRMEEVRRFGTFSGAYEIEAIAVDDQLGYVYYSDEGVCLRKYHAEPSRGDEELSCFGGAYFKKDIEGIAIAAYEGAKGYIIVSDQQRGVFQVFDRETNAHLKTINLGTRETDGCEVVTVPLGPVYPGGLFVAMSSDRTFRFYSLEKILEP